MKIYPDPELPDIEVEWYDGDCRDGTGDVKLTLSGLDDTTLREEVTVACSSVKATFTDVPRERYRLEGALLDASGEEFNRSETELDLRNGIDEHTSLYFGGFSNYRVAWTFDMGATCESLGVDAVQIEFAVDDLPVYGGSWPCRLSPSFGNAPDGIYSVTALALSGMTTVAVSPALPDVAIDFESFVNLGTFVLTPCGAECP
jgi:hypothetical protein